MGVISRRSREDSLMSKSILRSIWQKVLSERRRNGTQLVLEPKGGDAEWRPRIWRKPTLYILRERQKRSCTTFIANDRPYVLPRKEKKWQVVRKKETIPSPPVVVRQARRQRQQFSDLLFFLYPGKCFCCFFTGVTPFCDEVQRWYSDKQRRGSAPR